MGLKTNSLTFMVFITFGLPIFSQSTENCILDCSNGHCRDSCPSEMFLYISDKLMNVSRCELQNTTSQSTETSTRISFALNSTGEFELEPSPSYYLCTTSCPLGYYGNGSNVCVHCDPLCNNCTSNGITVDVCNCKYGNNSNETCIARPKQTNDGIDKVIIIGAAAGGASVVFIIIIVVLICCCYRKRKQKPSRTRMSVLINNRNVSTDNTCHIIEQEDNKGGRKIPTLQRQNYENTGKFDDSKVAKHAQHNQDKIFRYVKDPVTGKEKQVEVRQTRPESEVYSNAPAVRLNKNLQGVSSDELELAMLPDAPKPPGLDKKKKKSIFKKISSRRKNGHKTEEKGVTNQVMATTDEQEDYEDMSGQTTTTRQSCYTPFDPTIAEPQEIYQNFENDSDMPLEDYENFGKISTITSQIKKAGDEEELEDYENVLNALAKADMDDTEDQEDYENLNLKYDIMKSHINTAVDNDEPTEECVNVNEENPYMNIGQLHK